MTTSEWTLMGDLDMMMHIRLKAHEDEQAEQIGQVLQENLCSHDDSKKLNRKSCFFQKHPVPPITSKSHRRPIKCQIFEN
jgi:hypothetical protein